MKYSDMLNAKDIPAVPFYAILKSYAAARGLSLWTRDERELAWQLYKIFAEYNN